jgi:hypothetical protein
MSHNIINSSEKPSILSRRRFLGTTLAATVAYTILPLGLSADDIKRRFKKGVQIGAISYSFRSLPGNAQDVLGYLVQSGLTTVELMGNHAEDFAGAPQPPARPPRGAQLSDAEKAKYETDQKAYGEEIRKWRLSAPLEKYQALRKMYDKEDVTIDILKLGNPGWSDEENDYAFNVAHILGARGISFEISDEAAKHMAPFATKHKMLNGMHNHTQVADQDFSFDVSLSYSPYNMLNLDVGHYVAGLNKSPIPVIQQYHERISHLHLKDRKMGTKGGDNVPWGQGDTPLPEILQLLKKEQYPITGMIELEYQIPKGSDVLTEMAKCAEYCRDSLS